MQTQEQIEALRQRVSALEISLARCWSIIGQRQNSSFQVERLTQCGSSSADRSPSLKSSELLPTEALLESPEIKSQPRVNYCSLDTQNDFVSCLPLESGGNESDAPSSVSQLDSLPVFSIAEKSVTDRIKQVERSQGCYINSLSSLTLVLTMLLADRNDQFMYAAVTENGQTSLYLKLKRSGPAVRDDDCSYIFRAVHPTIVSYVEDLAKDKVRCLDSFLEDVQSMVSADYRPLVLDILNTQEFGMSMF